jgi:hypothetical protein
MKTFIESLGSCIASSLAHISILARAGVVVPLTSASTDGSNGSDAARIFDDGFPGRQHPTSLADGDIEHPGFVTSNGLGSMEIGHADD